MIRYGIVFLLTLALLNACGQGTSQAPIEGQAYEPQATRLAGLLHIAASEMMAHLLRQWIADFQRYHPALRITLETGTTSHAADALTVGAVDLAGMTRRMTTEEERRFEEMYGYPPVSQAALVDAVMVVVHADNPLPVLTLL